MIPVTARDIEVVLSSEASVVHMEELTTPVEPPASLESTEGPTKASPTGVSSPQEQESPATCDKMTLNDLSSSQRNLAVLLEMANRCLRTPRKSVMSMQANKLLAVNTLTKVFSFLSRVPLRQAFSALLESFWTLKRRPAARIYFRVLRSVAIKNFRFFHRAVCVKDSVGGFALRSALKRLLKTHVVKEVFKNLSFHAAYSRAPSRPICCPDGLRLAEGGIVVAKFNDNDYKRSLKVVCVRDGCVYWSDKLPEKLNKVPNIQLSTCLGISHTFCDEWRMKSVDRRELGIVLHGATRKLQIIVFSLREFFALWGALSIGIHSFSRRVLLSRIIKRSVALMSEERKSVRSLGGSEQNSSKQSSREID